MRATLRPSTDGHARVTRPPAALESRPAPPPLIRLFPARHARPSRPCPPCRRSVSPHRKGRCGAVVRGLLERLPDRPAGARRVLDLAQHPISLRRRFVVRLGMREWFFGLYLVANLAIILFSIWLWSRGMTAEAVFVGLWAPTLDLLYVMFVVTFKPFERGRPSRRARPSVPSRPVRRSPRCSGAPTVTCSRGDRHPAYLLRRNLATRSCAGEDEHFLCKSLAYLMRPTSASRPRFGNPGVVRWETSWTRT